MSKLHVEVRIADGVIYAYLHEHGEHISTEEFHYPRRWDHRWPSDATVRRYVRRGLSLARYVPAFGRITTLDA